MPAPAKKRWRLVLWIVIPLVICFVLLLADSVGLSYNLVRLIGDEMDWRSNYLAGFGNVNCGRVGIHQDASAATKCALEANAKAQPFRVIYNIQGYDEAVAGGVVRTPRGALLL